MVIATNSKEAKKPKRTPPPGVHVTYQLQYRSCGNRNCSCRDGVGHGPYWYAYWHDENKKICSGYVGKVLPRDARLPKQHDEGAQYV
jgi:hypothetical protein